MPSPRKSSAKEPDAPQIVRVSSWYGEPRTKLPWLIHGFSTRLGGKTRVYRPAENQPADLNLGFTDSDDRAVVAANRRLFLKVAVEGKEIDGMVTLRQIHSSLIRRVGAGDIGEHAQPAVLKGDGLLTDEPGVVLGIQTADCVPVLVADRKNRAVAAFHAGWRGTVARIVEKGIGRMRLEFGSKPENLIAAVGPAIGKCCYSVGEEVREQFTSQFNYAADLFREVYDADPVRAKYPMLFLTARAPGHSDLGPRMHLDLAEANRRQLLAAGLRSRAISMTGQCTGCHTDRFFSHRMERGFTGRMMSVIGVVRTRP